MLVKNISNIDNDKLLDISLEEGDRKQNKTNYLFSYTGNWSHIEKARQKINKKKIGELINY